MYVCLRVGKMDAAVKMEKLGIGAPIEGVENAEAQGADMQPWNSIEEGEIYSIAVKAKDARGVGIGKIGNFVIFVKNAKTRIGNVYKVKVTKVHRTFAYAELVDNDKQFIGNGSLLEL